MLLSSLEQSLGFPQNAKNRRFILSWSGGPDSTALLHLMLELRKTYAFHFNCLHINYGLRGEDSEADQNFCIQLARKKSLGLVVYRVEDQLKDSGALQERAREIRLEWAARHFPDWEYLEAHQADDQIETFLFRLLRGSGLDGLGGMKESSTRVKQRLARPLLKFSKKEILDYLTTAQLEFRVDRSNLEAKYDRNFIRNELIPLMEQRFPHYKESIFRLQEQIREESAYFDQELDSLWTRLLKEVPRGFQIVRSEISALPKALRYRFLHRIFWRAAGVSLMRQQILDLDAKILSGEAFVFNAPKGIVLRCGVKGNLQAGLLDFDFRSVLR